MFPKFALFVCAVVMLAAAFPILGQSCDNVPAWYFVPRYLCDTSNTGGPCRPDQPITFDLAPYYSTPASASCVVGTWQFPDGVVQAAGNAPFQRTLPVGTYQIPVGLVNSAYSSSSSSATLSLTVARGYVQLLATGNTEIMEGGSATFNVVRSNVDAATNVAWMVTETSNGTTPTTAVSPSSGTVSLAAGVVSQSFTVNTTDDTLFVGDKLYYVRLMSATNGYLPQPGSSPWGLNVRDNDYAIVDFTSPAMTVREDAGLATITLKRTGNLTPAFTVGYYVSSSSNVVGSSGTLAFASGETSKSFTVAIIDDTLWTGDRSVTVDLSNPSSGAKFPNGFYTSTSLKILEDEPAPKITVSDVSIAEGNAGTKTMTFTVKISQGIGLTVYTTIVPKTAQYPADFTGNTYNYLSFSQNVTQNTVSVEIKGDTVLEAHETLALHLETCCGSQIAMPPDAIGTILNDETSIEPNNVSIAKGKTAKLIVDIGVPAATPQILPLSFSDTPVLAAPQSVRVETGQSRANFEITGTAVGSTTVRVQLPPAHGGEILSTRVTVHDSGTAVFEPGSVLTFPGEEATVKVTLDPSSAQQQRVLLASGNANVVTVPSEVIIPAGGSGTFKAKGVAKGATFIKATLPAEFGSFVMNVLVDVVTRPATPILASVVPATGPTSGGTAFEARGSLLTADCTLLFGGVPATAITLNAEGALTGVTPPHANGTVDVTLRCGASEFALTSAFTYVGSAPSITAIAPGFGSTGGGTHVRATVANVKSGCWMFFGGRAAPYVWINGAAEMTAVTPYRAAAEAVDVTVRCGLDSATLDDAFAYSTSMEPSLSLLTVAPLSGAPGQSVMITGSRLRPTDRISFDLTPSALLQTRPESHMVRVPELPPGKSAITLVDAEGRVTTTGPIFTIKETAPPYISKVTPSTTPAGGEVALEGRGLRPGFTFVIGGQPARIVSLDYEHAVLRLAGGIAPGTWSVDVRDAAQHLAASGPDLTIVATGVVVHGVTASCDTTDGGASVKITGSGFAPGATATFNGVAASVAFISENELRATTPAGAAGVARVAVRNPNGDTGAISDAFRYRSPFDPAGCAASRGRSVRH